ncbi:hypothetical protein CY34DRAFT_800850 [Suillus luteus UH-Slu-Lm8-n1]|uniref:E3 ubiquitin-protein ligase n=1 Tax=Suillus luteus UH-Slu-Lm8-n1 TaxID=930992 RepID=A0A0D0BSY3_9AGAM|nr:hypothetical protein CY34DRAFT_800850 [Suillus luteus UH-Slu-Lm8-n1]
MSSSRKCVFSPATRAEVLLELYGVFCLPKHATLSNVQADLGFAGAGSEDPIVPGRPCGHIFSKGESCFRCKDCALDDSCVLCSRCFHSSDHSDHNVSFFVAQQAGGCCDCGDMEAWRKPISCPFHPLAPHVQEQIEQSLSTADATPRVTQRSISEEIPFIENYPYRVDIPPDLRDLMSRTIAYALDFILDTLDYSPDEATVPPNEADLRLQPSADPMQKDQYAIIIWNDDKHSFDEVIKLITETTGHDKKTASIFAHSIDDAGREIIDISGDVPRLLEAAHSMTKIELGVTIRRAYDTFREQVACVIIEWLLDLTRSRLGADTLIIKEIIAAELLSPRRQENTYFTSGPQIPDLAADLAHPCRIDWLFVYHTRLWKKPRIHLKAIYASILILSHPHKIAIASTTASLTLIFLLNLIVNFFTNHIEDKHILTTPPAKQDIDVESTPFRSKRFMPVFSDLRYLCHNRPVQQLIARHPAFIRKFVEVCQVFRCINPNKRVASNHVEYEADAWISVFNVTLSLSRVIKVYGEAFAFANPTQLVGAITTVVREILGVCTLSTDRLDKEKFSKPMLHDVEFGDAQYQIVDFNVLEGWVSFHHSLHWLLADLLKHVDILSEESLEQIGLSGVRDLFLRPFNEGAILTLIDFPLRVLAMIAQIRAGLWVRNGFPIRGQLLHYRDFMLRELCYDQDLFILQSSLIILDPNIIIVSILDRFGLLSFFRGEVEKSPYEGAHLLSMVEELLYVLITILGERASATKLPFQRAIRREIVHALAAGPSSFTDLAKRVSERMVDDVSFERVLKDVSHFRAPESTSDTGVYELKDAIYDEVDPFTFHYTRNKREEVEVILKNRLRKKTGVKDPVIVPKPLTITSGPFQILPSVLESEALLQVMFYAIYNVIALTNSAGTAPPSAEAILDQTFQLIMLALVERPSVFSHVSVIKPFAEEKKLADIICAMEHDEKYKPYKSRIDWVLTEISKHVPEGVQPPRKVLSPAAPASDVEGVKKRATKARQEAIMAEMKAQHEIFSLNFEEEEDENDQDMDETPDDLSSYGTCIVCQEDLNEAKAFGSLGLVQPSRLLRKHPDSHSQYLNELMTMPQSLDRASPRDTTFPPANAEELDTTSSPNFDGFPTQYTRFGLHASVCGHMMHLDCFQNYNSSIRQRHRSHATRNHPENIHRKEYICPLCKSLGNVLLPVLHPSKAPASQVPFPDWIRAAGISVLKSKPDSVMDGLQFRSGTGEFVFWSAQDPGYGAAVRKPEAAASTKMLDTLMLSSRMVSQQTRHLRERPEPEVGERGAGMYLPEDLVGYTISAIEVAARGTDSSGGIVADSLSLSDTQSRMIRGLLASLTRLAALELDGRPDGGRESVKQAIIKRLLPEWSRTSLTSFSYPLLLRDPFTVLIETAAVAPEMLQHVLILCYYACLARTVIGMVYVLNKARTYTAFQQSAARAHADIFGDVRMFFMSVVRHSPVFEHTATLVFDAFGEARIEKMLFAFTLPFLRRAAILCRSVVPFTFPTPLLGASNVNEYKRLLATLGIPPLADLPNQDTLQTALSGWCAHYGHSHAASQLNCGIVLDYAAVYGIVRLPLILDNIFGERDKVMKCHRCDTVPTDAAICLICGVTCCMASHCCQDELGIRGECNMHTRECGGAIGVYFVVKRCSLLYLYAGHGTFTQSPYLDVHGEVDVSMRRGRRQYIHPARWEEVRKTWLNHGIPTAVARKLESTVDSGGWETL